ncbi:MAG: hypothetical protein LBV07_05495 [Syntrophobacterales bacterium]|jgi:hypothetical protein|nr:hypothetical protein [Syntrophobacterales bacterium]
MDFEPPIILPTPSPPSTFVNILAWILILCGGLATCAAACKSIMFFSPFSGEELAETGQIGEFSIITKAIFSHSEYLFLLALFFSLAMLIIGIGLLKRKNWARIIIIIAAVLGILFDILALVILFTLFPEMTNMSGGEAIAGEIQKLLNFIQAVGTAVVIIFLAIHVFIIKKLCSSMVREEFQQMSEFRRRKSWE